MPLINDISDKDYEALDGINFSKFKDFFISPYHFQWSINHPAKETDDLLVGLAVHCMVLQPDKFYQKFAVAPKVDRRRIEDKAIWKEFCDSSQGKVVLTSELFDVASACADSVKDCSWYRTYSSQNPEGLFVEAGGSCEFSGSMIKGRIDLYNKEKNVIIDIKTCKDLPDIHQMKRYAETRLHYMQGFFYSEIVMKSLHLNVRPDVVFIYVHKKAPNTIGMINFGKSYMERAEKELSAALCRYENCKFSGIWPNIETSIIPHEIQTRDWVDTDDETNSDE